MLGANPDQRYKNLTPLRAKAYVAEMLHMDTEYGESSRRAHDGASLGIGHQTVL
ncbi:hypothetical protein [Lactobacillus phage Lbab1]|nr:hypothetical protein [Lactobacillus phage Lbab1]